jgi:hypothetical protein
VNDDGAYILRFLLLLLLLLFDWQARIDCCACY